MKFRRSLMKLGRSLMKFQWLYCSLASALLLLSAGLVGPACAALVGYRPLDDDLLDYSVNSNNGTLVNNANNDTGSTTGGPEFDSDVPPAIGGGKSARFDGLDDAINLGNNGGTQTAGISGAYNVTTNDWTISGWIKTNVDNSWVIFANGSNGKTNPYNSSLPGGIRTNLWQENAGTHAELTVDNDISRHDLDMPTTQSRPAPGTTWLECEWGPYLSLPGRHTRRRRSYGNRL